MAYRTRLSNSPKRNNIKTFRLSDLSLEMLHDITKLINVNSPVKLSESDALELILSYYYSEKIDQSIASPPMAKGICV
jgi:hypothetical protein